MSTIRERWAPRRALVGVAASLGIAALALTSCAADTGGDANGTADVSPIALTVARGQTAIENSIIAQQQGMFEAAGLDVTLETSQGATSTNAAVVSGEFDIALSDSLSVARAISEGMPITVVAGQTFADVTYEGGQSEGVVVPPGSTVQGWADLAGQKVGVADLGGLGQLLTMKALDDNGIDPSSVEFVQVPVPALADLAKNGEVAAVFVFGPFFQGAISQGFTPLGTGVVEFLPNAPSSVWIASSEFAANNTEAIERFREALTEANQYAIDNLDAVRAVYHENTELPAAFIDNAMVIKPLSVESPRDGWQTVLQALVDYGELANAPSYEDIVWEGARS